MEIQCDTSNPPIGGLAACELLKSYKFPVKIIWGTKSIVTFKDGVSKPYDTQNDILRILAREVKEANLYGTTHLDNVTVDRWLSYSLNMHNCLHDKIKYLDDVLAHVTFLVSNSLTIADLAVFSVLNGSQSYTTLLKKACPKHVVRWMKLISSQPCVVNTLKSLPKDVLDQIGSKNDSVSEKVINNKTVDASGRLQEGKFVDLPGAEMGKVVVRFPPEASGYLHIGHAKAALLNQYYQQAFEGKLIMRFDDTNPAKENVHFEKVILEDVEMLDIKPDIFTHTSQYFDMMLEMCERLIKQKKAFVDDTLPEQMKNEREQKVNSSNRDNSVEKNIKMWEEMKAGSEIGIKCCVRAKIDMQSPNGCMRDPTIYRCKPEPHPRTGTQYKVYPTYDFACPIVDAVEGVTHVLRTMEYHDRDPQFYWFIEALELRRPYIWEYSRLSMTNTVLSKRKLTWFVEEGLVDGWDDPRFPTVRGVLRRGMTVEGLKQFIIAQGSSRSVVFMEWDKIWSFNKKVIDPIAPRYTALEASPAPVVVNVKNVTKEEALTVPCHPKNSDVGNKTVWVGPKVLIDQADAQLLKEGENTTFINWGNIKIEKIHRSADGTVTSVDANTNLDDKDYKKTLKLTWLADVSAASFTPTFCVFFENIISKPVLGKDEDFKKYIGHTTRTEIAMAGDPELKKLRKGVTIQLQRRGFFRVDVAFQPPTEISGRGQPCILFHIPDGHTKEQPTLQQSKKTKETTPPVVKAPPTVKVSGNAESALLENIAKQGDKVRLLKEQKADKTAVTAEVQGLLALKAEYKKLTGVDWTPSAKPKSAESAPIQENVPKQAGSADSILDKITQQGDKIRQLKQDKADKKTIEPEVQALLALKAEFKKLTGRDWSPDTKKSAQPSSTQKETPPQSGSGSDAILEQISRQGDKIRQLKQDKADKKIVEVEVKTLLSLKADYKKATGTDWTPNTKPSGAASPAVVPTSSSSTTSAAMAASPASQNGDSILEGVLEKITQQGDKIRQLKQDKVDKKVLDPEIQALLALKAEYKKHSGKDWSPNVVSAKPSQAAKAKPQATNTTVKPTELSNPAADALTAKINDQGNVVRNLKSNKEEKKETVDAAVKLLLQLKVEYKTLTGTDFPVPGRGAKPATSVPAKKEKTPPGDGAKQKTKKAEIPGKDDKDAGGLKKQTRLGLEACKETDLSDWYSQVITKGEMIEYYDVSGCYILRPWSYAIWDVIREFLSTEIKKLGVKDCYFPIFVSKGALEREKTHIADFAPEVAWVTRSGETELSEHIAVRPTSETVMYPAYAKWIQSYRDLPLRLNQWNNVVRWEFQHPQPFLRSREFLWQEGHTAFATKPPADEEVLQILDLYARVYTDLLALPVVPGRKTEKEKFAGGDYTTTVEAFVPASGRGIQGATSHHLGQNFAKMFEIIYDDPETQEKRYVFQNSWGLTTRTIGVMVMVHGDNQGLVLPPRVASIQSVIVPCGLTVTTSADDKKKLLDSCSQLETALIAANVRVHGDYRDNYSPGWKFNHWELKGVPIRIELGPKDMAQGQLVAVRRDSGQKIIIKRETAVSDIAKLLETIHSDMLAKATTERDSHTKLVTSWEEFNTALDGKNIILAPYCGREPCEDAIKKESARTETEGDASDTAKLPAMGAKALCIPFRQPRPLQMQDKCIHPACSEKPKYFTLFGRSY